MMNAVEGWRRCNACKQPIDFEATYWVCNVSTCNRKRTGLAFCSVTCWEVHLPVARHRESWAVEERSPSRAQAASAAAAQRAPASRPANSGRRLLVRDAPARAASTPSQKSAAEREVLVIASRLKEYIRVRSGMYTSDRVLDPLSDIVRRVCDQAIRSAERDERKTVLDRDIPQG